MNKALKHVSATGLAMALATSAQALQFQGQVSFAVWTLPGLVASGSGSGSSGPGGITIFTTAWAWTGPVLVTYPPTAAAPRPSQRILLVAPGPCTFTAGGGPGGGLGGPCSLGGTLNVLAGGAPFLIVPLSGLGVAGRVNLGPYGSYIDAQSWTAATATPTVAGSPLTSNGVPITTVGYDARTAGGLGTVKLVAPAGLMSTLVGGNLPLFASMTLTFVPEPGTLLLVGLGIAGLGAAGRRRLRH
jgi:hypothetical protein